MTFFQTLLIACIPAFLVACVSIIANIMQYLSFRRELMSERAAKHYLKHKGYTDRSFETLKKYLGGWDNDEDELRRILVRAGAVRSYDKDGKEWWTLLSRMDENIEKKEKEKEKKN